LFFGFLEGVIDKKSLKKIEIYIKSHNIPNLIACLGKIRGEKNE